MYKNIIMGSIIKFERLKEQRLQENDEKYVECARRLMNNPLIITGELSSRCLKHGMLCRFIKQLEGGAAKTLAECK